MTARTIDEFHRSAPPRKNTDDEIRHLHALRQAEVSADKLTGDPDWDVYLSYLQHAVDSTQEQKRALERRLHSPDLVEHVEILKTKMALAECTARIDAWNAAISLPVDIKKNGNKAKDLIARMGEQAA